MEEKRVIPQDLEHRFKSKHDLYNLLSIDFKHLNMLLVNIQIEYMVLLQCATSLCKHIVLVDPLVLCPEVCDQLVIPSFFSLRSSQPSEYGIFSTDEIKWFLCGAKRHMLFLSSDFIIIRAENGLILHLYG